MSETAAPDTAPKTVLVTGGSGYIAAYVIAELIRQGFAVRATVRNLSREAEVRAALTKITDPSNIKFFAADLNSDAGWAEAVAGCTYVQHVASPLPSSNPKDDDELVRPARDGALRVMKAARDAGVKRVVMTASVACIAYGHGSSTKTYTEADWTDETNLADTSPYERSKTIAERAVRAWAKTDAGALEFVTIHPGLVLGPVLGNDFSSSIEAIKKLMEGSVPGLPRFGWPLVDVRDVASMHVSAMLAPNVSGERFIAAADFWWMKDLAAALKRRLGAKAKKIPSLQLPDFAVRLAALFDPVVRDRLFELGKERRVSHEKATRILGWVPRSTEDSAVDTAESLLAQGLV
jgi:dihydroflavonol-4-reductase